METNNSWCSEFWLFEKRKYYVVYDSCIVLLIDGTLDLLQDKVTDHVACANVNTDLLQKNAHNHVPNVIILVSLKYK